jgi:hypothetical protein
MSRRLITWMAVIAVLVLLGALGWLAYSQSVPVVIFDGFRIRDGRRVAEFTLGNNTKRDVVFESSFGIEAGGRVREFMGSWLVERTPGSGYRGTRLAKPGQRWGITLLLAIPNGRTLDRPFRVRFDYGYTTSIWSHPPLAWLPRKFKPDNRMSVWSEVVTP